MTSTNVPAPSSIVRKAIELMVWEGYDRATAAKAAGMLPKSLYYAFRKTHVKQFYLAELEVLRTSERSRNIHRLCEIRDAANNMPAVVAAKTLEGMDEGAARPGSPSPGVTIRIVNQVAVAAPAQVDVGGFRPVPPAVADAQRAPLTIDAQPVEPRKDAAGHRVDERGRKVDQDGNPIFQPSKSW
jgi:hypothetical protein